MILPDNEIKKLIFQANLLNNHSDHNIRNCAYNLRVGKMVEPETGEVKDVNANDNSIKIGPSETMILITKEIVNMPENLCATYSPLFRLAKQGIMLINASIVEPGYSGPLSCYLVNFSSKIVWIKPGDEVAKIVFNQLLREPANISYKSIEENEYENERITDAKMYNKSFMDISGIEDKAAKKATSSVNSSIKFGGTLIAVLLLWATLEPILSKWIYKQTGMASTTQILNAYDEKVKIENELENLRVLYEELEKDIHKLEVNENTKEVE